MPKGPKGEKRRADVTANAIKVMKIGISGVTPAALPNVEGYPALRR